MPLGKRKRRILLALGFFPVALMLLWVSLPLWFPLLLRPIANKYGVTYASYERAGYRHFIIHGLTFTNQAIVIRAERAEVLVPTVWLWRHAVRNEQLPFLKVNRWQFESRPATKTSHGPASAYTNAQQFASVVGVLQRWLPTAFLSNGVIRVQKTVVELPMATWARGTLAVAVSLPEANQRATVLATLGNAPYELQIHSDSLRLQSTNQISLDATGLSVQSTNLWWSNQVNFQAQFDRAGLLPEKARLRAENFRFPGEVARLKDFKEITGSVSANWEGGEFALGLNALGSPLAERTNLPPLRVNLHARGDTNSAVIESANISAPWLQADLSRNLKIYFAGKLVRAPAALNVVADLAQQPWVVLQGILKGQAELAPTESKFSSIHFQLAGSNVGSVSGRRIPGSAAILGGDSAPHDHAGKDAGAPGRLELIASNLVIEGSLNWPALGIAKANATFEDQSIVSVHGNMNLEQRTVAEASAQFSGQLLQRWLPTGYSYQNLVFSGTAHGPLTNLVHQGNLEITNFNSPQLQPLQVSAAWSGEQLNLQRAEISMTAGGFSLVAQSALEISAAATKLTLNSLTFAQAATNLMELENPCRISFNRGARTNSWSAQIDSFHWRGTAGEIQANGAVDWPRQGNLDLVIQNVHSTSWQDFLSARVEPFEIHTFKASGGWTNGPALFGVSLSAAALPQQDLPLSAELKLQGDKNGIAISNLVIASRTSEVAVARGLLPITLNPSVPTNVIAMDLNKPLQLTMTTKPEGVFWQKLADWTGIVLNQPDFNVNLSGTWAAPRGQIQLRAQAIQFQRMKREIPKLEKLQISVQLERERAQISEGQVLVQEQPVILTGEIPLGESFWEGIKSKQLPDWKKASARLRIEDAQLAPFSPLLPNVLAPQGKLTLNVVLAPGGKLDGELALENARTRPLATLGPIRDIDTKMRFRERTLHLESATAMIGGASVIAAGQADFRGTDWLKGEVPPFQFKLQGTNVPLSRQPESIIRSDLDLTITKTNGRPAIISGIANLRDSFYLRDLQDLIPGKVAAPGRRPPYFSVEIEPLADWRLDARVTGNRFLKVRSTLFNGEVSANLRIEGTLKDPVALGDVKIDSGLIRFPFASLQVRQGFVTLASEDPYRPQLAVSAGSKKFGYDLKMEASGPVDVPLLQFSSIPPLSSEEIVLMLTAGEVPKGTLTLTPQQKAQTVAVFLGRDLLAKFGLGDESEERLSITSGEQISEQGKPTYSLEYKLSNRWSLVGEYDRFNAFNAGLKWRIYSK